MFGVLILLFGLSIAGPPEGDAARRHALNQVYATWEFPFARVDGITAEELQVLLNSDRPPVLVDVRPVEERRISMIPGAISREELEADLDRFRGREIVTYCTVGVRSGFVANELSKKGLNVKNFEGSIMAWTHVGGSLVTPDGTPTTRVHAYGPTWDYSASAYQGVVTEGERVKLLPRSGAR